MATNYKIRLRRFNGLDYDTLNLSSENIIRNNGNTVEQEFNNIIPSSNGILKNNNGIFNIATLGTDYTAVDDSLTSSATKTYSITKQRNTFSTFDMLGIVITGNSTPVGASIGQYVIVKNSTISGITDGLYTAAQAIPANTAIGATYLTAVSGGGLNSVRSLRKLLWTNPAPNAEFASQTVNLSESASNFDKIEVVFFVNNSVNTPLTEIVQFEPGYRMHAFYWGSAVPAQGIPHAAYFAIRQIIDPVTGTTVLFGNVFHTPNIGTPSQAMLVPWKIYGIKY
jgi:hypothetical protein